MLQVLTSKNRSAFEDQILHRLGNYTRPVKTKRLAQRMNMERIDLVGALNRLRSKGQISYTMIINDHNDVRGRDDKTYGWILSS